MTDYHSFHTVHNIRLCKLVNSSSSTNKRYKEQIIKQIISAICAMLNSTDGKLKLYNECVCGLAPSCISLLLRMLEQSLISIVGSNKTVSNINFDDDKEGIVISVKMVSSLITTNYNLYLPSQTQVVQVFPWESVEKIRNEIIYRCVVLKPVKLGTHWKKFIKDKDCSFQESKTVMFKNLKADPTKRTTLADRMIGKGNKFSHYVSAFANHNGGHMYFGITDDGIVAGELIPDADSGEITKKVEKAIKKIIWPEQVGQPKQGEHWEIWFEPVVDENFNSIPSTFVIVIYIAPCLGGVFTEEPECYEMVDKQVKKMTFMTWKNRMLCANENLGIPPAVQRIKWSSLTTESRCCKAYGILARAINNGKWELFSKAAKELEYKYPEVEVQLVVLSQRVVANYRKGYVSTAIGWLAKYEERLPEANDHLTFKVLLLCLKATLKRIEQEIEASRKILNDALLLAESIPPGFVTASTLAFVAMHEHSGLNDDAQSPEILCIKVLEHLRYVPRSQLQAEIEQKAYINLAAFHLGYDISGKIIKEGVNESGLEIAKSRIVALHKSICNGFPLCRYLEIQFNLVQSTLYYRYSQIRPEGKEIFLEEAFHFSRKAQYLAKAFKFEEMSDWANFSAGLCTERLVLARLKKMNWVTKIYKSK